ncbi:hypothetical protein M8J76_004099 [Diaphorina citri]|nr:hypothetical protein M8J76_004099 [Diaphorina citri]
MSEQNLYEKDGRKFKMSQQQDDQQNQALQQQQPQQQQQQQQQNQQLMQQQIKLSQPDQQQDVVQQQQQQVQQQQQQVQQQNQQQQQQQNQLMQAGQIQQVQVIQNQQAAYLQQLYSGQGGLIMPAGNMQIGPMKVITQGQPGTYPTYPGTNNQTLVIGQLFSPQQGLIPAQSNQAKPQDMKPPTQGCVVSSQPQQLTSSQPQQLSHLISPIHFTNNGRTTVQSNQMQFTPWQFNTLPQGLAWASQPPILTQNSIFIGRGTQQDGSTQNPQANPAPMFVAMQQSTTLPQLTSTPTAIKTRPDHIQPKTMNTICRPLMPNSVRGAPPINTAQGSTPVPKKRTKQVILRAPLVIPTQKMNNTNNKMIMTSTSQLMQHQQHQQQQQTQTHTQLSAVASQQQIHASLSQHMGPTTQLTYTMAPPPPQGQYAYAKPAADCGTPNPTTTTPATTTTAYPTTAHTTTPS